MSRGLASPRGLAQARRYHDGCDGVDGHLLGSGLRNSGSTRHGGRPGQCACDKEIERCLSQLHANREVPAAELPKHRQRRPCRNQPAIDLQSSLFTLVGARVGKAKAVMATAQDCRTFLQYAAVRVGLQGSRCRLL